MLRTFLEQGDAVVLPNGTPGCGGRRLKAGGYTDGRWPEVRMHAVLATSTKVSMYRIFTRFGCEAPPSQEV